MKTVILCALVMACQKHDDTVPTSTSTSATASASAVTSVSLTPLATTSDPSATASAAQPLPSRDAGVKTMTDHQAAELAKKLEGAQLQMLGAYNGTPLGSSNVPIVDLSNVTASPRDGGRTGPRDH